MHAHKRSALLIALLLGAGDAVTGCDKPTSSDTVGQRVDRTTNKMAADTSAMASKNTTTEVTLLRNCAGLRLVDIGTLLITPTRPRQTGPRLLSNNHTRFCRLCQFG